MKKRILIFSLVYYPRFVGGAEVAIKEITDRLGDEYTFDMVTLRKHFSAFERIGKVNVHRVGFSKTLFPILAFLKAQQLNREHRYDAVWGMMAAYAGFGALFFKMRNPSIPFLLTLQEGDPIPYIKRRARAVYPFFVRIFRKADRIQAISHYLADFGRGMGFAGPLDIIPNGVDTARFSDSAASGLREEIRNKLGVAENDTLLITTSRLVVKNAIDDVIRALAQLPASVHFAILGVGIEYENLQKLAHDRKVAERVHFVGFVDHTYMPAYLHATDIFIRPSRSEGMGNSFIEAMAAGLPVIATQEGGIADFLFDPTYSHSSRRINLQSVEGLSFKTGWAVDKDSPEQIAEAVEDITAHPDQVARVTATAKKMAFEKYDWGLIARQMKGVFDCLLSGGTMDA